MPPTIPDLLKPIYDGLAEAFAPTGMGGLPEWLTLAGTSWKVFAPATQLADIRPSPWLDVAISAMGRVSAGSRQVRQEEFESLFVGTEFLPTWLYESQHIYGRVPGPAAFTVKALYEQAGLEIGGAELADHASLELAFLAFLSEQEGFNTDERETWKAVRQLFIRNHAGIWLPRVGNFLSRTIYTTWAAIGSLLCASLDGTTVDSSL